jgi:sugar phosphate isomerase/epimerase
MSSAKHDIRLGTTIYSLTNEYHSRRYSFEALVQKVAELGIGPGLEVVGFQSFREFPNISDATAARFRELVAQTGLVPTCLGINADVYRDRRREMTTDESVAYHRVQLGAAAKLGFPVARYQWLAGPEVIRRLAPDAERLGVKLGLEIHAPQHVQHPDVLAYREMYEKVGSPYLGFIPDFGASARAIPEAYFRYFRWRGIGEAAIDLAVKMWQEEGDMFARRKRFQETGAERGWDPVWVAELSIVFGLFSRQPPRDWLEIMPQVVHVHGKFYGVGDDGRDAAIPYDEILPVFVEGGYRGYISSEWEGHQVSDDDGFAAIVKHHALERRVLAQAA